MVKFLDASYYPPVTILQGGRLLRMISACCLLGVPNQGYMCYGNVGWHKTSRRIVQSNCRNIFLNSMMKCNYFKNY